ncbi:MAG: hypothetical protein QNJ94_03390 [Alphaproteobacteria bacterium]|nr:hypothetical protein [Alphaproteobacteria bacterium]
MNDSRASRFAAVMAITAALGVAELPPAWAQDQSGGPVRLVPSAPPATVPARATSAPGLTTLAPTEVAPPGTAPGAGEIEAASGITAVPLPAVDPESTGLLNSNAGGLGVDMWSGTSHGTIRSLMPRLPADSRSPAVRDLMRRLLLSAAKAPAQEVAGTGAGATSLLGLRAERLLAMGDREAVEALARVAGRGIPDIRLAEVHADALLLSGDNPAACRHAREAIASVTSRYLQKILVFCHALEGERAKAMLGVELLLEQSDSLSESKQAADDRFVTLLEAVLDERRATLAADGEPTGLLPLDVAMLRAADTKLPADILETADLALLAAMFEGHTSSVASTGDPRTDQLDEIRAIERGVTTSVISVGLLRVRYEQLAFDNLVPAHVLSMRDREYGPEARARLHQAIVRAVDDGQRAQLLAMQLSQARRHGDYHLSARAAEDQLREIGPSADMLWFAGEATRGLYAVRRIGEGRTWFRLLTSMVAPSSHGDRAASRLWPLVRLADGEAAPAADSNRLRDWWQIQQSTYSAIEAERRAALLFAMFDGLEEPMSDLAWQPLMAESRRAADAMSEAAMWRSLAHVSLENRRGETALRALISVAESSPEGDVGRINALVAREAIVALRRVGLEDDARAIAFDIALAAGL